MTTDRLPIGRFITYDTELQIKRAGEQDYQPVTEGASEDFIRPIFLYLGGAVLAFYATQSGNGIIAACSDRTSGLFDPKHQPLDRPKWQRQTGRPGFVSELFGGGERPALELSFLGHPDRMVAAEIMRVVGMAAPFSYRLNLNLPPETDDVSDMLRIKVIWSTPAFEASFSQLDDPFFLETKAATFLGKGLVVGEIGVDQNLPELVKFRLVAINLAEDGLFRMEKGHWVSLRALAKPKRIALIKKFAEMSVFFRNINQYLRGNRFSLATIHALTASLLVNSALTQNNWTPTEYFRRVGETSGFNWSETKRRLSRSDVAQESGVIEGDIELFQRDVAATT